MTVKVGDVVKRRPEFLKTETGVKGFVDLAGYAACAGEIAEMEERGKI